MNDGRPQMEVPQKAKTMAALRRILLATGITLPVALLTYRFLMDGLARILWGSGPSNIPGVIQVFQLPDFESSNDAHSDFPKRWSVDTDLFIDREDSNAIYVFPEGTGSPQPLFRLNLATGSMDRVANTDPLAFISTCCEGFRSMGRLEHSFSGISLPAFDAPSPIGGGMPGLFHLHHWGRDRITFHMNREDLVLGDIPIADSWGQITDLAEAYQDPSRRRLILHADGWLVVLNPPWSHKLPIYPWASIQVSTSGWQMGDPNPTRAAEVRIHNGRWYVEDAIHLAGNSSPLRDISLLISPPAGFSFSMSQTRPFGSLGSESTSHPAAEDLASQVTWKDVPKGRVFTISRLPRAGDRLVLPIRFLGPQAAPNALPLTPYSAMNDLQHPSSRHWFFQAGSISFIQGPGACPPPALDGEPWFNWHCELPFEPTQGKVWAQDRR